MSAESQAEEIFLRVVELDAEERERLLEELSPSQEVRQQVEQLIAWDARVPERFLSGDEREPAEIQRDSQIGPYRVLERLGEGGMGTVFAAQQSFPERNVALKVLRAGRVSESAIRRFRHEIDILGRLQHIGIARIYDAGTIDSTEPGSAGGEVPYFTMELVRGVPLVRYAREQALALPERLELFARVCEAVHYAHQRGVIHRDLKTDNVLVTAEESTAQSETDSYRNRVVGQPKVLDFGIARVIDPELGGGTRHTLDGTLLGTLSSMSPEQVSGASDLVDVRSDVYSLGVLLYELICGRAPIALDGLTVPQAIQRILESVPVGPGEIDPALRGDPTTIALKALEKDPERRYQTAFDLASDLRCYLRGEPIEARADSRLYLLRRSLKRHRLMVGAATFIALLVGAFALWSAKQARVSAALAKSESEARELADADFQRALTAVDLLTDLGTTRLDGIPQAEPARRELLRAALEFHRGLLEAHPSKSDLLDRQAVSRYRVAQLERELGLLEAARESVDLAIDEFESAEADEASEDNYAKLGIVSSLTLQGNLLYESGDLEGAEEVLSSAVDLASELLESTEASVEDRGDIVRHCAAAYRHLSNCLGKMGRVEESLEVLLTALDIVELELERDPSPYVKEELVGLLQQICVQRLSRNHAEDAEPEFVRAIELAEELVDLMPTNTKRLHDLAATRNNYSMALDRWGRLPEARIQVDAAIAIGEKLVAEHPDVEGPRKNLFVAYNNRANMKADESDLEGAESDLANAETHLKSLLATHSTPDRVGKLAILENNRAALLIRLARLADAVATLESSIENAERALVHLPGSTELLAIKRFGLANLGLCHVKLGDHRSAASAASKVTADHGNYISLQEVAAVLSVWEVAIPLLEEDESLDDAERDVLFEDYFRSATDYLLAARRGGFTNLSVLEQTGWDVLLTYPPFEEALTGE